MHIDPSKLPAVQEATATADRLAALAGGYRVTTAEEYSTAGAHLLQVNGAIALLEQEKLKVTRPIEAGLKAFRDFMRPFGDRLEAAKGQIKRAMVAYDNEQERIRIERQREAEAAAQRERDRLAREAAERQAEADRKAAAERQAAEAARSAGNIAEAEKHERKADQVEQRATERVEVLQDRAATVVAPVLPAPAAAPKVAGVSGREVWKFEVLDPNLVPREFLVVDEAKIRRYVGAMKGDSKIAGVRVYSERDYNVSRRGAA